MSCADDDHNGFMPPVSYEGSERTVARYIQSIRPHDERTYRPVENVLFLGPSGIGNTYLSIALGYEVVKAGHKGPFITTQELTSQLYASLADVTIINR